ncbi:MAG: hypothetical protein JW717_12890 [Marinilabiliaceae bacterium]|nr:hypothetical protein [Marinilabiliaceae bacterium]
MHALLSSLKRNVSHTIKNIPGWRTNKKYVVFESDDWGSIRMPSGEAYRNIINEGVDLISDDGARFNKYDTLASVDDISCLYDVLMSVKDYSGRPAVITPVAVVANPDFERIEKSGFSHYFYEPFTETLKKYPNCFNSYSLWKEGIDKRLFVPEFHGREHVNVKVWMRALANGNYLAHLGFRNGMWGISSAADPDVRLEFQAAFDFFDKQDLKYQQEVIETGLELFYQLFGFKASFFVPPNGPVSSELYEVCFNNGIRYISMPMLQLEPLGNGLVKKKYHWMGQKNKQGIVYLTRNCFFEPSDVSKNWVDSCLREIDLAFKWKKPAIISSHRVNFVGGLDISNRDNGILQLKTLFQSIIKKWPDVEFVTSAELGKIINND